jgi:hypothetical protein
MELHFWLIPLLALAVIAIAVFYAVVSRTGGDGTRGSGRTMVDKPEQEEKEKPNVGWNYYR